MHYTRWAMWGDVNALRKIAQYPEGSKCRVEDCPRKPQADGYCGMHYQRIQIHGDPFTSLTGKGHGRATRAYVYVITREDIDALKVGLGAVKKKGDRIQEWRNFGWHVDMQLTGDGVQATFAEMAGLTYLREELLLPPYLSADSMPGRGGWTETAQLSQVPIRDLESIIKNAFDRAAPSE